MLVYCGQTAGWIKMPLGMEVGLGPGDNVLRGDPVPPKRGTATQLFGPCLLWPNGWMDQDATPLGTEVDLVPGHIVLDGDSAPPTPERGTATPFFLAYVYCGQTVPHLSYC